MSRACGNRQVAAPQIVDGEHSEGQSIGLLAGQFGPMGVFFATSSATFEFRASSRPV